MHWTTATIRIPDKPFLTLSEVAAAVGYSSKHVRRWVGEGKFPLPVRVAGGSKRWTAMSVGLWIANQEQSQRVDIDAPDDHEIEKRKGK